MRDVTIAPLIMDGNVLPDDCLTMYSSDWNADPLTLLLRVFDPVIWTFPSSLAGRMLVYLAKFSRFTYLFRFSDATLQHGHITPIVFGWSVRQWLVDFLIEFRALRMKISGIEETPVSADLLTADIHSAEL